MTVIEPPEPTPAPTIGRAFRHIGNRGPASPYCMCGRCLSGDDYSDTELALDACVTRVLDMVAVIESRTSRAHASIWMSLRVLHELVDDARNLLCVQRRTARASPPGAAGLTSNA